MPVVLKKILSQRKWLVPLLTILFLVLTDVYGLKLEEKTFWAIVSLVAVVVGIEGVRDVVIARKPSLHALELPDSWKAVLGGTLASLSGTLDGLKKQFNPESVKATLEGLKEKHYKPDEWKAVLNDLKEKFYKPDELKAALVSFKEKFKEAYEAELAKRGIKPDEVSGLIDNLVGSWLTPKINSTTSEEKPKEENKET